MKFITILITILLLHSTVAFASVSSETAAQLDKLDSLLARRSDYLEIKSNNIGHLTQLLSLTNNLEQRYDVNLLLADEYAKWQLDSVVVFLQRNVALASRMHDTRRETLARLKLIGVYSSSGYYLEAEQMMSSIDTVSMDSSLYIEYYKAAHSYNREMREYSINNETKQLCAARENYYIDRLIESAEPASSVQLLYLCTKYVNLSDWERLNSVIDSLLALLSPDSPAYALAAYFKALASGDGRGSNDDYIGWLARSAMTDVKTATRDHASLCMIAQILFYMGDIERALGYIQVSMDDAIFFNSRLRPWQVAGIMPIIERAYQARLQNRLTTVVILIIVIAVLLIVVGVFALLSRRQNRKIKRNREHLEEMNLRLNGYVRQLSEQNELQHELTEEISEANAIKEQYIGLFLVICSDYIDKLKEYQKNVRRKLNNGSAAALQKELASSTFVDDAIEEFYATFDNTFLSLYPTFVKDFNALLCDDQQITLKNDRQLNTELRIFALIRLGITDSSRIASLLRYSVNTIYNYRASVKNRAKVSRDDFEEAIKKISSFRNS